MVWATITSPCGIIVWTECVSHNTTQRVCIIINFFISKWKQLTGWGGRPLVEGITLVFPKLLEGIIYIHTNTLQWWPWFTYNMNTTPTTLVCHPPLQFTQPEIHLWVSERVRDFVASPQQNHLHPQIENMPVPFLPHSLKYSSILPIFRLTPQCYLDGLVPRSLPLLDKSWEWPGNETIYT